MRLQTLADRRHVVGVSKVVPHQAVEPVSGGDLLGGRGADHHVRAHLDPGAGDLAQVNFGDPGRMHQQHLHTTLRPRPPVPRLHVRRPAETAFLVQQPGPAGVDEERLAVVAER